MKHRHEVEIWFGREIAHGGRFSGEVYCCLHPELLACDAGKISTNGGAHDGDAGGVNVVAQFQKGERGLQVLGSGVGVVEVGAAE